MNTFYEQMHRHTKIAKFSIFSVHCTAFLCPLSLLVVAALNLRAGACRVLPKGGRGLGFAPSGAWSWVWAGGWAAGLAEGCAGASTSMGAASRAALGLGSGARLASSLGSGLARLGAGSAGGSAPGLALGFFLALAAFLRAAAAFCCYQWGAATT